MGPTGRSSEIPKVHRIQTSNHGLHSPSDGMVRLGQLLDPAHKMARLRPDAVRAEQVVPQDPVHLRLGPPHHSVLDFRGAHPRRLRAGRLSTLRVSVAWARQVQVASQERGIGDVAQDRQ